MEYGEGVWELCGKILRGAHFMQRDGERRTSGFTSLQVKECREAIFA